ncbi:hypothetical protein BkAM31D_13725 [Halalkalibacter krulwichiae]|uniref:Uncharacterized protein n=1 Tax=Halalkalibacter krulwichiae TaxID=199441 RepID=A0A1X9MH32_9BACI|nr:hypothetical protein BkAM31D_13725 [Halalkalibacter krulwichiae]
MSIEKKTIYYAQLFKKMGILTEEQKKELVKALNEK